MEALSSTFKPPLSRPRLAKPLKPKSHLSVFNCSLEPFRGFPIQPMSRMDRSFGFPCNFLYEMPLPKQCRTRKSVIVRLQAIGVGSPDAAAAHPLPGAQLTSKLRGICFYAVTSILALFLIVVMFVGHPFVLLFDRYKRNLHHQVAKIWAALTVKLFFPIDIEGLENLPPSETPAVYVANHESFLDIYTVLTLGRSFKLISKTGIFLIPVVGWAMYMLGTIPIRRMDSSSQLVCLKRCMDIIGKGASVFFFPEGTRSRDGKMRPFKKGAFSVAAKVGVPVVPITLIGAGELMPPGKEGILNMGSVRVIIHKPIEGTDAEVLCSEAEKVISNALSPGKEAG